ncbi:MAG: Plug domain-containing protein [Flavisolibacter sp.]
MSKKDCLFIKYSLLLFIWIGLAQILYCQGLDSLASKYALAYPQERAYIHFDKSSYFPGETVWFKTYLMAGLFPADESKTFYADWVGDNGEVLSHTVSPMVGGTGHGQFDIPTSYSGNFLHLRAYSKWMLNFDTAFIYKKDIAVIIKNPSLKKQRATTVPTLVFFPEGGEAVEGLINKIAFRVADQWGRPVVIRGVVVNSRGQFMDSLKPLHDGMGYFHITPQKGENYASKWKDEKGAEHTTSLPSIKSSGISLEVFVSGNRRILQINGLTSAPENLRMLHLVGTMQQNIVFKTDALMKGNDNGSGVALVKKIIPTGNLPSGILTITVFDARYNAIAERITFVNNWDYSFHPSLEMQHWGLNKRARNLVKITVPDSITAANLSVSVTDAAIETDSTDNIIAHFLLSSELKGAVYHPAYYFTGQADSINQNLDLVMMTHGWRRFKWEEVLTGRPLAITYPKDSAYLNLSGKVFGVAKSQLSGSENIILVIKNKDSSSKILVMPLDRNGSFGDPTMVFFDTLRVYYHLKSKFFTSAEAKFMTDRLPAGNFQAASKFFNHGEYLNNDTSGLYYHGQLSAQAQRWIAEHKEKILEVVTVRAKQKSAVQILEETYPSGFFKGGEGYQFDLVHDVAASAYSNIFTYLQGKVAGLLINPTGNPPTISLRGSSTSIFLDEMNSSPEILSSIPVADIAYIKVFPPPFMGAPGGGSGGAVAIYTRRGGDARSRPGGGMTSSMVAGYTPIRQFYSPNYDAFDPKNEQPDLRTTLYWNPSLETTPKNHSVTFSFYNNDVTKSFRVIVEGMTREGLLTHFEQILE